MAPEMPLIKRGDVAMTLSLLLALLLLLLVPQAAQAKSVSDTDMAFQMKERGKPIESVTAQDLYKAYTQIQQDYAEKAFGASQKDWLLLNKKDGVEVSMLQTKHDPTCPYVRMECVMPTTVQHCWDFLQLERWDISMPKMDPFYEGVMIKGIYDYKGVNMKLARKRTKRILAFGKRDFVFISVSDLPSEDGTWISGSVSVVTPEVPRCRGYTRGFQDSIAFYKPLPGNQTRVTIVCRLDLNDSNPEGKGGLIPMWLYVKMIGKTGAMSVFNMRRVLVTEVKNGDWARREKEIEEEERRKHHGPLRRKRERYNEVRILYGMDDKEKKTTKKPKELEKEQDETAPSSSSRWWKSRSIVKPEELANDDDVEVHKVQEEKGYRLPWGKRQDSASVIPASASNSPWWKRSDRPRGT